MKKILIALCSLFVLVGCSGGSGSSGGTQTTACTFEAAEGLEVDFDVSAKDDTINKLAVTVVANYDVIGADLSTLSETVQKSTADAILAQLGFDKSTSGIDVNVEFTDKAMTAVVTIDLESADASVLEKFGFKGLSDEDLSFSDFLKQAKENGMECK